MSPNGREAAAVLTVLPAWLWFWEGTRTGAGCGDGAGHQDRDGRWNTPLPGTCPCPTKPPAAPFHIPFPQSPLSPGMKPGWPKCHPCLCGRSPGKGNQPPQHRNHPDKMPNVMFWGLHPSVELHQPSKLISCPAKGSVPALWGQKCSSPLAPWLSFPLVKGGGD